MSFVKTNFYLLGQVTCYTCIFTNSEYVHRSKGLKGFQAVCLLQVDRTTYCIQNWVVVRVGKIRLDKQQVGYPVQM